MSIAKHTVPFTFSPSFAGCPIHKKIIDHFYFSSLLLFLIACLYNYCHYFLVIVISLFYSFLLERVTTIAATIYGRTIDLKRVIQRRSKAFCSIHLFYPSFAGCPSKINISLFFYKFLASFLVSSLFIVIALPTTTKELVVTLSCS